ncbi:unnamed protein product [Mortierella alpina]
MARDMEATSSLDAPYDGPYQVVRRTSHGTYILRDAMSRVLARNYAPEQLKIAARPDLPPDASDTSYEVERIISHRTAPGGKTLYLVKWKGYDHSHNSEILAEHFDSKNLMTRYHRSLKQIKPSSQKPPSKFLVCVFPLTATVEFQKFYSKARITVDLEMSPSTSGFSMEVMSDLFKRYGSSVRSLITNGLFNDDLIDSLDKNVYEQQHSILKTLVLNPTGLSYCKTDDIERVLSYASELKDFSLQLEQLEDFEQQQKAARLLEDHGPRLTALSLSGRRASTWLLSSGSGGDIWTQKLAYSETLTRQTMPNLKSLDIVCHGSRHISQANVECIASMVMEPAPLTEVRLEGMDAHLADWERIFKALCFSSLVELSFKASNVTRDVLLSLVRCIPVIRSGVPLRILNLANTLVARGDDDERLDPVVSEYLVDLKKRAPYAKVSL